ncbi:hypothetical protein [Microbacterium sp. 8M]|uniref:hypothetical protein n=1 Tax=Microbacterium sp. 8M TaxID=2653153 RepID=UPI00135B4727|nr:hypothetical protein [Microbacterium sp. 8M]
MAKLLSQRVWVNRVRKKPIEVDLIVDLVERDGVAAASAVTWVTVTSQRFTSAFPAKQRYAVQMTAEAAA